MSKGKDGGDGAGVTERLHRAEEAESATPEHTAKQEDRRKWTQMFPLRFQSQENTSRSLWME